MCIIHHRRPIRMSEWRIKKEQLFYCQVLNVTSPRETQISATDVTRMDTTRMTMRLSRRDLFNSIVHTLRKYVCNPVCRWQFGRQKGKQKLWLDWKWIRWICLRRLCKADLSNGICGWMETINIQRQLLLVAYFNWLFQPLLWWGEEYSPVNLYFIRLLQIMVNWITYRMFSGLAVMTFILCGNEILLPKFNCFLLRFVNPYHNGIVKVLLHQSSPAVPK